MTCGRCGLVEVPLSRAVVSVDDETAAVKCVIRCPQCLCRMERDASDAMAVALTMAGAVITPFVPPVDAIRNHDLPPLTSEDVDDFCRRLECAEATDFVPGS